MKRRCDDASTDWTVLDVIVVKVKTFSMIAFCTPLGFISGKYFLGSAAPAGSIRLKA